MTRYTVRELQQMCRERGIKGFSRKKREELVNMLDLGKPQSESVEKVVRDVHDILFPENRIRKMETRLLSRLQKELEQVFEQHHFVVIGKKDSDFILENGKILTIRGNLQDNFIPRELGEINPLEFSKHFEGVEPSGIKNWITQRIHLLLPQYLEKICGDYLLWIDEKTAKCKLFNQPRNLFFRDLTFTRRIDQWKNKNTVKTGKNRLGDFIITDDCIHFHFKSKTLFRLWSELKN